MIAQEALALLRGLAPFDRLPADTLAGLAASAAELKVVPGQAVVREGEAGDRMYLVAAGSVQVIGKSFDGSEVVLARLEAGAYFGEQALLPGGTARRTATVRALTHGRLLALPRASLHAALEADAEFAQRMGATARQHDELRAGRLREGVLRKLGVAESYRIERFGAGEHVFRQGDQADRLYLVLQGQALVSCRVEGAAEGTQRDLTELLPGQFFGELAILGDQPRTASVRAVGELEVASLDAAWFRANLAGHPQLQPIMQSLDGMYLLPRRGLLTLQTGQLATHPTLTAMHNLPDGRRVISTRLVGMPTFTSRVLGAPEPDRSVRFDDPDTGASREVHLADGVPVELESSGEWRELGEVFEMLLDAARLEDAQIDRFESRGSFAEQGGGPRRRTGIVCACAGASFDDIEGAIAAGCHTAEQVAARTRATVVCGGCLPIVQEMLGLADWTPARCESIVELGDEVRAFRIKPLDRSVAPFRPGQHLVVQARIGDHWVQRPYTISSAPGGDGAYEITVKREPGGVFSRWLFERRAGDALLRISAPGGSFHLPSEGPFEAVCLVGGIGVTPALSMARTLARTSATAPRHERLHIDYSVSEPAQAIAADELRRIAAAHPNVTLTLRTTRVQGRIDLAEIRRLVAAHPAATFYLCGSDAYMATVARHLATAAVAPERVRQERFTVAGERPALTTPTP